MKNLKINSTKILLIAIGNCGRGDDGLGWKFADQLQARDIKNIDVEYRYQLQVEDAALVSAYDTIIFVDASHAKLQAGFEMKACKAAGHFFYSSHMQSPEAILYLAHDLYDKYPNAYTLAISGYEWELKTSLSKRAASNLEAAFVFFMKDYLPTFQSSLLQKCISASANGVH